MQKEEMKTNKKTYKSYDDLKRDINDKGMVNAQVLLAFDFSKSTMQKGYHTLTSTSLFEKICCYLKPAMDFFDLDNQIYTVRFGDHDTKDKRVLPLDHTDDQSNMQYARSYDGMDNVIAVYRRAVSNARYSGPTSFTPIFKAAMALQQSLNQYLIVIIVTDGDSVSPMKDELSLIEASHQPISFVAIDLGQKSAIMQRFDDVITQRLFDNFQYVNYDQHFKQYKAPVEQEKSPLLYMDDSEEVRAAQLQFCARVFEELPEQL